MENNCYSFEQYKQKKQGNNLEEVTVYLINQIHDTIQDYQETPTKESFNRINELTKKLVNN